MNVISKAMKFILNLNEMIMNTLIVMRYLKKTVDVICDDYAEPL